MAIITLTDLKDQLAFTADMGTADDAMLSRKIEAAQSLIERQLGFRIEATYGGAGQDPVPPDLKEAVAQLAAHFYENREAATDVQLKEIPFGVREIVGAYRNWTF